ncbi:MAG: nucleotidyltransferase family protein [Gemmatimonadetes bacterium]|nr:nucleotidyltransferase family protein [Gemmatimonadota bacterium]
MNVRINIPNNKIAEFCQRHHIRRLALFGSVLRDDFTPESDVDILVDFEPGKTPGLDFFTIQDELSKVLGRRVDLYTFKGVENSRNWILREEILNTAEVQYEQT